MSDFGPESFSLVNGGLCPVVCSNFSCLLPHVSSAYFISLHQGRYLLEAWGASGGSQGGGNPITRYGYGGLGGYSKGILTVKQSRILFGYVGGSGQNYSTTSPVNSQGGWNGGGGALSRSSSVGGGTSGGGASDLCTVFSEINTSNEQTIRSLESYKSRLLVAGGGGGGWGGISDWAILYRISSNGGYGGGETSSGSGFGVTTSCSKNECGLNDPFNSNNNEIFNYVSGSNQTHTGGVNNEIGIINTAMNGATPGAFGYGGSAIKGLDNPGGGGGGGWFGGRGGCSGHNPDGTGGAGGSGYVHTQENNISSLPSLFILSNAATLSGSDFFPIPNDQNINESGHLGNGFIRITLLSIHKYNINSCIALPFPSSIASFFFLLVILS